jgi:hypothetical protein
MRKYLLTAAAAAASFIATSAHAAPGLDAEVYGATVEKGRFEFESRYNELAGGPDDGEGVIKLEGAYAPSRNTRFAVIGEFEREPGETRKLEAAGFEVIHALGRAGGLDFAVYGEYEIGVNGHADKAEAKLLVERRAGPLDFRFNLIGEKELEKGEKVELEYAASADVEAFDDVRLGIHAFGELGGFDKFLPSAEHFAGPVARTEIEGLGPEIEIEAGYLFAIDKAKDDTNGQFRLALEVEF